MDRVSIWLISLFLMFAPLLKGGQSYIGFMIYRLTLLLLLTIFFLGGIKNNRLIFYRSGLEWPIFAFFLISLLTTIRSFYFNMSLEWLLSIFFAIIFFYLLLSIVKREKEAFLILELLFCLGLVEAVVALSQFFLFNIPRAAGTFSNPNFLALYLIVTGSLGIGTLLSKSPYLTHLPRSFICISFLPMLLAIITTGSRGAVVVISAVIIFFSYVGFKKKIIWPALLLVGLILVFPNPIRERLFHGRIEDNLRPQIWMISLQEMLKHPFGIGLGMYKYYSAQFDLPVEGAIARYGKKAGSAHNDYLEIGVGLGIAGLLVFLWGIFCLAKRLRSSFISEDWRDQTGLLLGLSGGIFAIFVHTAFDLIFHEPALVFLLVTYTSVFLVMDREKRKIEPIVISPLPMRHPSLIIGMALVLSLIIVKPTLAWILFEKGNRAIEEGDIGGAISRFEWTVSLDKGNAYYHDTLAYTYFMAYKSTGDNDWFNKALSELEYAISLNPLEGKFLTEIGTYHYDTALNEKDPSRRKEVLQKAIIYYQKAAKLHPFYPVLYNDLGLVYKTLNEYGEAKQEFEKAIQIEPNFLPARINLAMLYKEEGRYQDAKRELDTILSIKERYKNSTLSPLEEQYLALDERKIQEELNSLLGIKGESSRHDTLK